VFEPRLGFFFKLLAFLVTIFGLLIIYFCINLHYSLTFYFKLVNNRSCLIWFIVPMSTQIILKLPFTLGKNNLKVIDQG